ncbi:MAG TPA: hypothetical protein VHR86_08275, partial [Armatimonadota bacterium]|nr:hypothetical protein [Armatimonadota bacterium]
MRRLVLFLGILLLSLLAGISCRRTQTPPRPVAPAANTPEPAQPATVPAERQLTVYFAAETPNHTDFGLVPVSRRVQAATPTTAAEAALQALAAGPTAAE